MHWEKSDCHLFYQSLAVKQCMTFFNTTSRWQDWTKLHCYVLQCKNMACTIPAVSSTNFSESRTVYFCNIATTNGLYISIYIYRYREIFFFFFFSMIALGELIVILNMVFLPAYPQGKEKSRKKHGITVKPDTCTEHDLLWALRYCDFLSQRQRAKWKGKYKQCGTCLITTQQKNGFFTNISGKNNIITFQRQGKLAARWDNTQIL